MTPENQVVAIIGGTGKFGQHLAGELEKDNTVIISGRTVEKAEKVAEGENWKAMTGKKAASEADIVIVSVPISVTVDVIHEIGPSVSEDTLFCDVTSIKQKPCEAMSEYSDQVLGMHPMYAPSNSIEGQKVVLCPVKGEKWEEMKNFWEERGADTHVTNPEDHDTAVSVIQGLMHFSELVVAETLRKQEVEVDEMSDYSSPVYQLITDLTARMLNQKAGLYHSIQSENPQNEKVRREFIESAEDIRELIGTEEFEEKFEELQQPFNMEESQERTDAVIEFLSDYR